MFKMLGMHEQSEELAKTILLAEDDELIREIFAFFLRQQGYVVIEAGNGIEALNISEERIDEKFDLLLTDIEMPIMGGLELANQIRISRPDIKVLLTSGSPRHMYVYGAGADGSGEFLAKPFSFEELGRKVKLALDRQEPGVLATKQHEHAIVA